FSSFGYAYADHRDLHSFPTRRSSDLTSSKGAAIRAPKTAAIRSRNAGAGGNTRAVLPSLLREKRTSRRVRARPMSMSLTLRHSRSEEHTSELQSRFDLVCRLLLEKKK